jgi:hypothetical protein
MVQTDDRAHPYLGVFHDPVSERQFATYAAYSTDLVHWHTLVIVDDVAAGEYESQPDIRVPPDDTVLFAAEYNRASRTQIQVRYYGTHGKTGLAAFIGDPAATPTFQKVLPNITVVPQFSGGSATVRVTVSVDDPP